VARLLRWMARDQYGFWSHVEDDIASALDEAGRAACAGHLKRLLDTETEPAFIQRQIDTLLRAVYIAQRDAGAYIALAERSGLTAKDCLAMATILAAKDDPAAAGSAGMISRSRRTRRAGVPASGIMVECPMMNCWNVSASSALADGRRRRSPAPSRCAPRL